MELCYLFLTTTLWDSCYCTYYTDEEILVSLRRDLGYSHYSYWPCSRAQFNWPKLLKDLDEQSPIGPKFLEGHSPLQITVWHFHLFLPIAWKYINRITVFIWQTGKSWFRGVNWIAQALTASKQSEDFWLRVFPFVVLLPQLTDPWNHILDA